MQIEFFGIPRQRAGLARLELEANTLGDLLTRLTARIPSLAPLLSVERMNPAIVVSLNGDRFISDPATRLSQDDSVLILSADAGG